MNTPQTTIDGGTFDIASPTALPVGTSIVNNAELSIQAGNSTTAVNLASITGTGSLTVGVAGTPAFLRLGSASGSQNTSSMNSLTIAAGSTLDLNNNPLIINFVPGSDPAAKLRGYLQTGYNADTWTGPGIVSSNAAANPGLYAVGYADGNTDVGTPAATNQIYIQNALAGDANLDGIVNFPDLLIVAQNYGKTGQDWAHGDFNYDGIVNFSDLLVVAQNYGKQLLAGQLSQLPDSFASQWQLAEAEIQSADTAAVPEPTMIGSLLLGAAALLGWRKRHMQFKTVDCPPLS